MARRKALTKEAITKLSYNQLMKVLKDPETSPAVRVQCCQTLLKLAQSLPEGADDELQEFMNNE